MPIDGVEFEQQSDCYLCHINELSDELKTLIRNRLSAICHGKFRSENEGEFYKYSRTLVQFNERLQPKDPRTQKGMIGELLFHVLIVELISSFQVISPFFNLEEKSIKKGFDVILTESETGELWITETKSGEKNEDDEDSNSKNISLLNTAKTDLRDRLGEANTQRWQSALNGIAFAMGASDKTKLITKILQGEFEKAENNQANAGSHNAILSSNIFSTLEDKATIDKMVELKATVDGERIFSKTLIFTIQKNTYEKVKDFLTEEARNG